MVVLVGKGRSMGIHHLRVEPSVVFMFDGKKKKKYLLKSEDDELDFVLGRFPTKKRKVKPDEDLSEFLDHQIKWRKLSKKAVKKHPENLVRIRLSDNGKKEPYLATHVPVEFDGLKTGDVVGMVLGGSGDMLASALSRQGENIGAEVFRISTARFKEARKSDDKSNDAMLLAELVRNSPELFQRVTPRDRKIIALREKLRLRSFAMKDQLGTNQRIGASLIGRIFCTEDGPFPEGSIKFQLASELANDVIAQNMLKERERREKELTAAVNAFDVYQLLFKPITGVGPMIAAGLICAIQDVRRFETHYDADGKKHSGMHKLKKYCGVHVQRGGIYGELPKWLQFPRGRHGIGKEFGSWSRVARQALYNLADQFNRRPDSKWGKVLVAYRKKLRETHPIVECSICECPWEECTKQRKKEFHDVEIAGKKIRKERKHNTCYTDIHLHKMAAWKTLNKFIEWLWKEWMALEMRLNREQRMAA